MKKLTKIIKKGMSLLLVAALTVGMLTGLQKPLEVQAATPADILAAAIISACGDSGACTVSDDIVTMQKNVTMTSTVAFSAGIATLDLNSYSITGASSLNVINLTGGGLTVDDTAGNGKIISNTSAHYGMAGIVVTNSQLILQNGAIENPGGFGSLCVYIGYNGIFDMYGGSLQTQGEYAFTLSDSTAICNLYGGLAEGKGSASVVHEGNALNLKVSAGKEYTIKVNDKDSILPMGAIWQINNTYLDCAGTVICQNTGTSGYGVYLQESYTSLTIKKGTLIASGPQGAFSKAPVISAGTTVTVYAGADEASAVLVETPISTTYTSNKYVKIVATFTTLVTSAAISGITAPVAGQTPSLSAICSDLGVGLVGNTTWTKADGSTFAGSYEFNTTYKASVTLTPASDYAFNTGITTSDVTVNGSTTESVTKNGDGTLTVTYTFPTTVKAKLQSIAAPSAVIGVANGTTLASIILPTTVTIVTEDTSVTSATVAWVRTPANGSSYSDSVLTEQTFTLNGTVSCPTEIDQDAIPLTTSISVTVSAVDQVEAPTADVTAGTYTVNQNVQLSSGTAGATIYYTTDGSIPTTSSSLYSSAIPVTGEAGNSVITTIKAIAVKDEMLSSVVSSFVYTINQSQYTTTLSLVAAPTSQADYSSDVKLTAILENVDSQSGKTITFYDGENLLGTKTTDSTGKASCTVISPAVGAHAYKAVFAEETANKGATSNIVSYTINKATQAALSYGDSIPTTKTYGDTAFIVTVTGGTGNGGISYISSDESVATVDSSSGKVNIVGEGKFTITATKAADGNYKAASITSSEITVTKNKKAEELANTKNTEKAVIDSKATAAKVIIDALTNLAVSEKNANKEAVDREAASAKASIDAATDTEGVTTSRIYGIHSIEGKVSDATKASLFEVLQAKVTKTTNNSNTLTWKKISGADGYIIYGNRCGNKYKFLKITTTTKASTEYVHKKLKKGTYYKYRVVAYKLVDGKPKVLSVSKTIHSATDGGKVGNAKSIKVNKSKVTLKLKQAFQIKAKEVKQLEKIIKHRGIVYQSTNSKIATVSAKGVIQAKEKGKCTIYLYAQNGTCKEISVTVE